MLGQGSRLIWHPGWGSLICYLDSTANLEGQCPEEPVASLPTILSNPNIPVGRGGTCWDSRSALLKVPTVAHREWVPALVSRSDMTWHSGQLYLCGNLDSMPAGVLHNTCNCPWALHCSDLGIERDVVLWNEKCQSWERRIWPNTGSTPQAWICLALLSITAIVCIHGVGGAKMPITSLFKAVQFNSIYIISR